jgi:four helix bundle protein
MDNEPILDYEKLEVYQLSLQFVAASARILAQLPAGYSSFADQLRRAALSVPLNIAEAVGKTQMPDR